MAYSKADALSEIARGFSERDPRFLRKVNDRCIEALALGFDRDFYNLAIISYALSKMLQKPRYWENPRVAEMMKRIGETLGRCSALATGGSQPDFASCLAECVSLIDKVESADRRFVRQPVEKARLKIAATLYAQGFSLGSASELTGMDKREILSYAGRTMMFDRVKSPLSISERLRKVRKIFGK